MSFYEGLNFFIVLVLALIPAFLLGLKEINLRYYTLGLSILFLFFITSTNLQGFFYLMLFFVLEWYVIQVYFYLRKRYGKNKALYVQFLVLAILPVLLCKISSVLNIQIFTFIGVSYVSFKVIQIVIESYDGLIEEMSFLDYSSFILFFPSISSGPIDRSRRYLKDLYTTPTRGEYVELAGQGIYKIVLGILYKFVFGGIAFTWMSHFSSTFQIFDLIGYAYLYGIYMFFDFAGYSAMAIGTSYLLGIRTPENFNKPFLSIDIKDFWNRWHMSLSYWFRDFVFTRFMLDSTRKKRFSNRLNTALTAYMVNMIIMGFWHGITPSYILYGIYHGCLLAGFEWFQKKTKIYKNNRQKKWYKVISWFVTLNLVMFGFLIFSGRFLEALQHGVQILIQQL